MKLLASLSILIWICVLSSELYKTYIDPEIQWKEAVTAGLMLLGAVWAMWEI